MFFNKKKINTATDRINLTTQAKTNQFVKDLKEESEKFDVIFACVHFQDSYAELKTALENSALPFNYFDRSSASFHKYGMSDKNGNIFLSRVDDLPSEVSRNDIFSGSKILILVYERFPDGSEDKKITDFASMIGANVTLRYYGALDEPLLKLFSGERLTPLLSALGLKDDEFIEHPMISNAIEKAMEKVASLRVGNTPAYNSADWMKYNIHQEN